MDIQSPDLEALLDVIENTKAMKLPLMDPNNPMTRFLCDLPNHSFFLEHLTGLIGTSYQCLCLYYNDLLQFKDEYSQRLEGLTLGNFDGFPATSRYRDDFESVNVPYVDGLDEETDATSTIGRRSNFSDEVTKILLGWLKTHISCPYPTDLEKEDFVKETKLDLGQINHWFINARRRYLPKLKRGEEIKIQTKKNKKRRKNE